VKTISIVLAEDHHVVRQGLRALLAAEPDLEVVGEAASGLDVGELVEQLKPDVLVVDFVMPGLNAPDIVRRVARLSPRTRALVLSMHANPAYVVEAIQSGAAGYVLKGSSAAELVRAIRAVAEGSRHLSPPLSEEMVEAYARRAVPTGLDLYRTLTQREREVLHLAAEGLGNPAIGERLGISPRTAETHRTHVMQKLGLRSRTDLIVYAIGRGLIPAHPPGALPPATPQREGTGDP
jgi:DNA-binding NarL/FixJ family response regulator